VLHRHVIPPVVPITSTDQQAHDLGVELKALASEVLTYWRLGNQPHSANEQGGRSPLGWQVLLICTTYGAVQLAYSCRLKHLPVIDLACVASGFVLRVVAGAAAMAVPASAWLILVTTFGSLLIAAGKRYAEILELGAAGPYHRRSLGSYRSVFLARFSVVSGLIAIAAYCFWALGRQPASFQVGAIMDALSIVPLTLAVARHVWISAAGEGGQPEDVFLSDRMLQLLVVVWAVVFAFGVYTR
jgi:decaprenyl-phosphate phosphoribosyltransferase